MDLESKISSLNQLHKDFQSQLTTDTGRLQKIQELIEDLKKEAEVKPLYSLPLEGNVEFLIGKQKLDEIRDQKSFAVKNKNFERAAQLRDEERKETEVLYKQFGEAVTGGSRPFLLYQGVVYWYELDSRVQESVISIIESD